MDELGVIGLVAGLWIALAQPGGSGGGRAAYPARLGWLLMSLSAVLILSGSLAAPAVPSNPDPLPRQTCVANCIGQPQGVVYRPNGHRTVDMTGVTWPSPG